MAINLTSTAIDKSKQVVQKPQIVLQIDGISKVYGAGSVKKYIRIGDDELYIGDDWTIGGLGDYSSSLQSDIISLDGTSSSISQQIQPDKGSANSISSIQISLLDRNGEATELISPGSVVDDILGRKAEVYLGYFDTAFPQDFVRIFTGVIDEIVGGPTIVLNVAHPEQKKRSKIFQKQNKSLTADLNYKSATINGVYYQTLPEVTGTVTIAMTGAGIAGLEGVGVVGFAITVDIQPGVSTAEQVRTALSKNAEAMALVYVKAISGSTSQSTFSATSLNSDLTANVTDTVGMLQPADSGTLRTYIRIGNEVIEYGSVNTNQVLSLTRQAFYSEDERSFGTKHASGSEVSTVYRLTGNAIDLALKLYMSGPNSYFATGIKIETVGTVEEVGSIPGAIYFSGVDVSEKYGLVVGDYITITGDSIPSNNVTMAVITGLFTTRLGSYLTIDQTVTDTLTPDGECSFASKYNVLPDGAGLGLGGDEVDVSQFEYVRDTFSSSIFEYDFYIKDSVEAKDFIDQKILFPTGAFTLPRKGKISIGYSSPPLAVSELKVFDSSNTTRPDQTRISRSINRNFYNTVVFKFNDNILDDKLLSGVVTVDADSKDRINVGNKVFEVEAPGLRPGVNTNQLINNISSRILDRFKFGAERVVTTGFYGDGFALDVGDVVLFGDSSLQIPDSKFASREFKPRLFEISNKKMDIKTGVIGYELLDTAYSSEGARYCVFSPASKVGTGSTTTSIKIKTSFATVYPANEFDKWSPFIGEKILVHNDDWSFAEEVTFVGFDPSDSYRLLVSPSLSSAPSEDFIVDIANYDDSSDEVQTTFKNVFGFVDTQVDVTSGSSQTQFDIDVGDVSKFIVGKPVIVHLDDWSQYSTETKVASVSGTTITVEDSLGFTPTSSHKVDLLGFEDGGDPYRYI